MAPTGTYNAGHSSRPGASYGGHSQAHSSAGGAGHKSGSGHSQVGPRPKEGSKSHRSGGSGHSQSSGSGSQESTPGLPEQKTVSERLQGNVAFKGIVGTKVRDSSGNVSYGGSKGHQFQGSISSGKGARRVQTYVDGEKVTDTDRVYVASAPKDRKWQEPSKVVKGIFGATPKEQEEAQLKKTRYEKRAFVPSRVQRKGDSIMSGMVEKSSEQTVSTLLKPKGFTDEPELEATKVKEEIEMPKTAEEVKRDIQDELFRRQSDYAKKERLEKYGIDSVPVEGDADFIGPVRSAIPVEGDVNFIGPVRQTDTAKEDNILDKIYGVAGSVVGGVAGVFKKDEPEQITSSPLQDPKDEAAVRRIAELKGRARQQMALPPYKRDQNEINRIEMESAQMRAYLKKMYPKIDAEELLPEKVFGSTISSRKEVAKDVSLSDVRDLYKGEVFQSKKESDYLDRINRALESDSVADVTTNPTTRNIYMSDLEVYKERLSEGKATKEEGDALAKMGYIDTKREMVEFPEFYSGKLPDDITLKTSEGEKTVAPFAPYKENFYDDIVGTKEEDLTPWQRFSTSFLGTRDVKGEKRKTREIDALKDAEMEKQEQKLRIVQQLRLEKQANTVGKDAVLSMLVSQGNAIPDTEENKEKRDRIESDIYFVKGLELQDDSALSRFDNSMLGVSTAKEEVLGTTGYIEALEEDISKIKDEDGGETTLKYLQSELDKYKLKDNTENDVMGIREKKELVEKEINTDPDYVPNNIKNIRREIAIKESNLTEDNYDEYLNLIAMENKAVKDYNEDQTQKLEEYKTLVKKEETAINVLNEKTDVLKENIANMSSLSGEIGELEKEELVRINAINQLGKGAYEAKMDVAFSDPLVAAQERQAQLSTELFKEGKYLETGKSQLMQWGILTPTSIIRSAVRGATTVPRVVIDDIKEGEYGKAAITGIPIAGPMIQGARGVYDWTKPKEERYVDWETVEGSITAGLLGWGAAAGYAKTVVGKTAGKAALKTTVGQKLKGVAIKSGIALGFSAGPEAYQTLFQGQSWERGLIDTTTNLGKIAWLGAGVRMASKAGSQIKIKEINVAKNQALTKLELIKENTGATIKTGDEKSFSKFVQSAKAKRMLKLEGTPYRMEYKLNPKFQFAESKGKITFSKGKVSPEYRMWKGDKVVLDWTKAPEASYAGNRALTIQGNMMRELTGLGDDASSITTYDVGRSLFITKDGKYFYAPSAGKQSLNIGGEKIVFESTSNVLNPIQITKSQYQALSSNSDLLKVFKTGDLNQIFAINNMNVAGPGYTVKEAGKIVLGLPQQTKLGEATIFKGTSESRFIGNQIFREGSKSVYTPKSLTGAVVIPPADKITFGQKIKDAFKPLTSIFGKKSQFAFTGNIASKGITRRMAGQSDDFINSWVGTSDDVMSVGSTGPGSSVGSSDVVVAQTIFSTPAQMGTTTGLQSLMLETVPTVAGQVGGVGSSFGIGVSQLTGYFGEEASMLPISETLPGLGVGVGEYNMSRYGPEALSGTIGGISLLSGAQALSIPGDDSVVETVTGGVEIPSTIPGVGTLPTIIPGFGGGSLIGIGTGLVGLGALGWGLPPLLAGKSGSGSGGGYGMGSTGWTVDNPVRDLWGEFKQRQRMKAYQPSSYDTAKERVDTMFGAVKGLDSQKATRVTTGTLTGLGVMSALKSEQPTQSQQQLQESMKMKGGPELFGTRMMQNTPNYSNKIASAVAPRRTAKTTKSLAAEKNSRRKAEALKKQRDRKIKAMTTTKKPKEPKVLSYRRKKVRI